MDTRHRMKTIKTKNTTQNRNLIKMSNTDPSNKTRGIYVRAKDN